MTSATPGKAKTGKVQTDNTPSRDNPEYFGNHIEWIKSDNILDDEMFVAQSREMLSNAGLKNGRSVEAGAMLMTCIAGSLSSVGDVALTDRRVSFNQQMNAVMPNKDVNPFFLYALLKAAQLLVQYNASAGMKLIITKSKLEELNLIKPPLSQQEGFATVAKQHERLRLHQRETRRTCHEAAEGVCATRDAFEASGLLNRPFSYRAQCLARGRKRQGGGGESRIRRME